MKRFVVATILVLSMTSTLWAMEEAPAESPLPASLENPQVMSSILAGEWKVAAGILENDSTWIADPRGALLAAHMNLATGGYNHATFLFYSITYPGDLELWRKWTGGLCGTNPKSAIAHYLCGDAHARLGELEKAVEEFAAAIDIDPRCYLAYNARGLARSIQAERSKVPDMREQALDGAVEDFDDAQRINPEFLDATANMALIFIQRGNADSTMAAFQRIIDKDPSFAMAHNGRACVLERMRCLQEAEQDVIVADSLCRTPYTLINAKLIVAMDNRNNRIEQIASAVPDSGITIRGYAESEVQIATAEQYVMPWQERIPILAKAFTGTFFLTGALLVVALGVEAPAFGIATAAVGGFTQLTEVVSKLSLWDTKNRGGVYFETHASKAGTSGGLMTEAVLNYPRSALRKQ